MAFYKILLASLAFAVMIFFDPEAGAQIAVQTSSCSVQNVVANNGSLKIENLVINCGKPADPKTAIKVSYFWLDSNAASVLMSGNSVPRLRDLLGVRPIILRNDVSVAFDDLNRRFGTVIGTHSNFTAEKLSLDVVGVNDSSRSNETHVDIFQRNAFKNVRAYDAVTPIFWPDIDAVRTMTATGEFPAGYAHYVRSIDSDDLEQIISQKGRIGKEDTTSIMNSVLTSRVFSRNLLRGELENYRSNLVALRDEALKNFPNLYFVGPSAPKVPDNAVAEDAKDYNAEHSREEIRRLPTLAGNKSLAALLYLSQQGMPADFVIANGIHEEHAGSPMGWGVIVIPRRPFLQIAVIENAATTATDFDLNSILVEKEDATSLRRQPFGQSQPLEIDYPTRRFIHREKIIIPLSIEFRHHQSFGREDFPDTVEPSNEYYQVVRKSLDRISENFIVQRDEAGKAVSAGLPAKRKSLFETHNPPRVEGTYIYGPRLRLRSVRLNNWDIEMRAARPAGVVMVAGFEGGSCPILYYRIHGSSDWSRVGPILARAVGPQAHMTEEYELPSNVAEVAVVEEEPERSHISSLVVTAHSSDGVKRRILSAGSPFKLDAGEAWSAIVPYFDDTETIKIAISGRYTPYNWGIRNAALPQ